VRVPNRRPLRVADSTRRIVGPRLVNVWRGHDIPFGAVDGWLEETDFVPPQRRHIRSEVRLNRMRATLIEMFRQIDSPLRKIPGLG
jgi:hypothetical protein